jgi:hypothetical protein
MVLYRNFISTLMTAVSTSSLYSIEHPRVGALIERSLSVLSDIFLEQENMEIMLVGEDLILNRVPLRQGGTYAKKLITRLKRKGVSRIDISREITSKELADFIEDLTRRDIGFKPNPHIRTGVIGLDIEKQWLDADVDADVSSELTSSQMEKLRDIFDDITLFKRLNMVGLDEVVAHFITTLKREAQILRLLSPLKSDSEYTYTHATNVAILTIFQADSLGVEGEVLHEIGVAAVLHDVGKMFVSKDIINKNGKLTKEEFQEVTRHTLHGAKYLAKMEDLTRLAPIVAFEHHLRYDMSGYPDLKSNHRKQHPVSQLVQIADVFDALRSKRPYKKDWPARDILALIKENAGTEFRPDFVNNFVKTLVPALSE